MNLSILLAAIVATSPPTPAPEQRATVQTAEHSVNARREACMFTREESDSRTKVCYYRCNSGEVSITIRPTSLCPRTLDN